MMDCKCKQKCKTCDDNANLLISLMICLGLYQLCQTLFWLAGAVFSKIGII